MGGVRSVDFSKDSRHLITGSDDKTAKVIIIKIIYLFTIILLSIRFNRYGPYLAESLFVH